MPVDQRLQAPYLVQAMDFGRILDEWEQERRKPKRQADDAVERWLAKHPPVPKDRDQDGGPPASGAARRRRLREIAPQARLDLHGCSTAEAVSRTASFLRDCKARRLEKVLIVHGKGNHSASGPVLKQAVRQFLERSKLAGECGTPDRRLGGQGATWVVLR